MRIVRYGDGGRLAFIVGWTHGGRCEGGDDPVVVSEKVVCRIMREDGLRVAYARRKRRYSSYAGEVGEAPENLVNRDFHADAPNVLWLTDITEFRIPAGKVCLSPILDCYGGHLPAWSIALARNPLHPHLVQLGHHLRTGKAPYQHALDDALG